LNIGNTIYGDLSTGTTTFANRLALGQLNGTVGSLSLGSDGSQKLTTADNGQVVQLRDFPNVSVANGATVNFDFPWFILGHIHIWSELVANAGLASFRTYWVANRYGVVRSALTNSAGGGTATLSVSVSITGSGTYCRVSVTNNGGGTSYIRANYIGN